MTQPDTLAKLAAQAAATIEMAAMELKAGHVVDDEWPDDEVDARAFYETDMALVADIRRALSAQALPAAPNLSSARMATSQEGGQWRIVLMFDTHAEAAPVHTWLMDAGAAHGNAPQAAQQAAQAPAGWLPIESAPKDAKYQDGHNHYADYILGWYPGALAPVRCRWWFRDDSDACNFLADGGYAVFPTVFQPLPRPPQPQEDANADQA